MHYFIDGYNLLFRLLNHNENLQNQREAIIYDLSRKISLVKIDASIVFDAAFQIGDRTRTHYNELEILFTAEGETADEYIVSEIKNHPYPRQETVVTSDKKLAQRVRNRSARTKSVEEFIIWLNRAYQNKIRQIKKGKQKTISPPLPSQLNSSSAFLPEKNASLEAYNDYYAQIFEAEWQDILKKNEEIRQKHLKPLSCNCPKQINKIKRHDNPSELSKTAEDKDTTEMERWLRIFEKRLMDDKKK